MKQRFAGALARYKPKETDTPLEDDIVTLRVHHGELWFATPEPEFRIAVEAEKDGVFGVDGPPIRFSFVNDKTGRTTALKMMMPGERTILLHRLPN